MAATETPTRLFRELTPEEASQLTAGSPPCHCRRQTELERKAAAYDDHCEKEREYSDGVAYGFGFIVGAALAAGIIVIGVAIIAPAAVAASVA